MAEEQKKALNTESPAVIPIQTPPPAPLEVTEEKKTQTLPPPPAPVEVTEEKKTQTSTPPPAPIEVTEEKIQNPTPEHISDDSKALVVVEKPVEPVATKSSSASNDRDVKLADLSKEKLLSFAKAFEESEKSKAENKAEKKISDVLAWEKSKKAAVELQLKKIEEQLEKKKAEYAETMKNKIAAIHKEAEEKRAMIEAKRGEDMLKAEEMAAKYRATGTLPKATCGCF